MLPVPEGVVAVNVKVVPLTEYAVVGSCLTFSINTDTELVVATLDKVYPVLPPLKVSLTTVAKLVEGVLPKYGIK